MTAHLTAQPIELDADEYDFYELSAEAYGGIGAGANFDEDVGTYNAANFLKADYEKTPCCIQGHFFHASAVGLPMMDRPPWSARLVNVIDNDGAVHRINARKGVLMQNPRVQWDEYCAERNIVRKAAA